MYDIIYRYRTSYNYYRSVRPVPYKNRGYVGSIISFDFVCVRISGENVNKGDMVRIL